MLDCERRPHNVSLIDWMANRSLVVSSIALGTSLHQMIAHRVVCAWNGEAAGSQLSAAEQQDGSVKLACGGSSDARVIPQSHVVQLTAPVSPMGRWVLQRSGSN